MKLTEAGRMILERTRIQMLIVCPEHFNMSNWFAGPGVDAPNPDFGLNATPEFFKDCGTTGCIAGHMLTAAPDVCKITLRAEWSKGANSLVALKRLTGVPGWVFYQEQWPDQFQNKVHELVSKEGFEDGSAVWTVALYLIDHMLLDFAFNDGDDYGDGPSFDFEDFIPGVRLIQWVQSWEPPKDPEVSTKWTLEVTGPVDWQSDTPLVISPNPYENITAEQIKEVTL